MIHRVPAVLAALVLAACSADPATTPLAPLEAAASLGPSSSTAYDVTITNLTTGQPMSPAVLVTHTNAVSLFAPGTPASAGIQAIAENGDPSVSAAMLTGAAGVHDVVTTNAPIHRIGGPGPTSITARITAARGARWISLATMLICTNDGFAGVRDILLPINGKPLTVYGNAYDSGTEANTESSTDIVPPCFGIGPAAGTGGGGRVAESSVVRMHPGLQGGGALTPALHGWVGSVLMITIQRVAP